MPTVKEALGARVQAHVAAAEAADRVKRDQDQLTADQQAAVGAGAEADKNDAVVTAIVTAVGEVVDDDGTTYQILGGKLHEFTPRRAADVNVDVNIAADGSITVNEPAPPAPPGPDVPPEPGPDVPPGPEPAPDVPPGPDVTPGPAPPEPTPPPAPDVTPNPNPDNPPAPDGGGILDEPTTDPPRGRARAR